MIATILVEFLESGAVLSETGASSLFKLVLPLQTRPLGHFDHIHYLLYGYSSERDHKLGFKRVFKRVLVVY
jgi:hypothetical protein